MTRLTARTTPARRVRLPQTLRGRLTAALALILTLALGLAALAMIVVVRHVLFDRLDDQLRAAGDRFSVALEHSDHDADDRYDAVEGQLAGTLGARAIHGTVTAAALVGRHEADDAVPATARARLGALRISEQPRSVYLPGVGEYRVLVVAGRDHDVQITGLPTAPIEDTITKLAVVVIAVVAVALLMTVGIATGVVSVMLRPLKRVSATAADVAALPLATGEVSLPHRVAVDAGGSEVDVLARAFNAMLEEVESALGTRADSEDRLRRFIADASHELRTPIAVVRSHAELATREGGGELPDGVARSLTRITAQAQRMGRIVEDLLLLARLDSGRPLAGERVDLVRVVLDAVDDARTTAPGHHWRMALPAAPLELDGDAHALAQVVANLLANAAIHTPDGTTVTVSVAGDGTLTVSDDGPGMPAEIAATAFDRFVRGDNRRAETQGSSGLGLPIVAAIVAAHHGTIALDSGATGTTVQVTLRPGPAERVSAVRPV